jgi:hypothetical protein
MGRPEKEARDERLKQQQERITVYSSLPYQTFMVHAIKAPVVEGVFTIFSPTANKAQKTQAMLKAYRGLKAFEDKFPEPQHGNEPTTGLPYAWHPNSHALIDLRDEFFKHCHLNDGRCRLLRTFINAVIIIYDYDPPYRMMIDWWAQQLNIQNWRFDMPVTVVNHNWEWWTP